MVVTAPASMAEGVKAGTPDAIDTSPAVLETSTATYAFTLGTCIIYMNDGGETRESW